MNHPSHDEYEEVESPFASKSSDKVKSSSRDRLRTRKNVFNRPFAAESTIAPTYSSTSTRRAIGGVDNTELIERHSSDLANTEIEYLDEEVEEEEEEVETRPARRTSNSPKKKIKLKQNLLAKCGWVAIELLVLRLIFMDRGVWDYFSTEHRIKEKNQEHASILKENSELKSEISRIHLDKNYQRHLAKEHLGVIAVDEFLILFADEAENESNPQTEI